MTDRDKRSSPFTVIGDGVLLLCALCGLTGSFLSLYGDGFKGASLALHPTPLDICAAQSGSLVLLAGGFALAALAVWSLPRYWGGAAGGLAALWGLLLLYHQEVLSQGAGLIVHTITVLFAQRVSWGLVFPYDPGLGTASAGAAVRLFLLLALAGLALILGWAVVRARRWWIVAVFTLPPLLPGLLADLYPGWPPFLALCACWCAMLLTDLCKWAAPDRRGVLTLIVLPCVAAVLGGITLAFPRADYTRPDWALRWEARLYDAAGQATDFFAQFEGPFRRTVTYVGSAEEADLAHAGPLGYTGRTVLRVRSDYAGRLYLRGASLAVYEDGVWKSLPEGTYDEYCPPDSHAAVPLYFPALQNQGGSAYTVTVENVGAVGACVYAPYFPLPQDSEETGALPVEDAYFAHRRGQWEHTLSFVELPEPHPSPQSGVVVIMFTGGQGSGADFERYSQFVYDHYLDVPEGYREHVARFCMENGVSDAALYSSYDAVQAAREVASLLDRLYEYDQTVEPPPEGVDPVAYFLTESRRGYCMHFASAATLMLRSLGIPARYVSGFTVESFPGSRVNVPDRAAHAWVEVWISGFGWYPVEVTPAAAFTWYNQGELPVDDRPSDLPEESEAPEPTPTPSQEPGPSDAPSAAPLPGESGAPEGGGFDLTALLPVLRALGAGLGILALLWLGQRLPKRYRARRLRGPDRNRAALYGYRCLCRMERWGGRMEERAVELAQRARFSQHTLTPGELEEMVRLVDRQRERLCVVLDPLPRLLARYFWGMPRRGPIQNGEQPPERGES